MNNLLKSISLFVQDSFHLHKAGITHLTHSQRVIMDADPEKVLMRKALEHYANSFNWPYEMQTPDGIQVVGMDVQEATEIAQKALDSASILNR